MTAVRSAIDRPAPRLPLLALIVAAHLLAIWLLLRPNPNVVAEDGPALSLFDVLPPPLLEEPPPPPPPLEPKTATRSSGGGSPGIRRQRPAQRTAIVAPPAREVIDTTPSPIAPLPAAALSAGSAIADLGAGGAGGVGSGTGSGRGDGDGDGAGATAAPKEAMARALWIKRPPNATFAAHWPIGSQNLTGSVVVELTCLVRRTGKPYRCRVRSERPRGLGFYRTALAAMPEALVRPVSRDGEPMWDTPVIITVEFGRLEVAPPIPLSGAASAPRAR